MHTTLSKHARTFTIAHTAKPLLATSTVAVPHSNALFRVVRTLEKFAAQQQHATDDDAQMKIMIAQLSTFCLPNQYVGKSPARVKKNDERTYLRKMATKALRKNNKLAIEALRDAHTKRTIDKLPSLPSPENRHTFRMTDALSSSSSSNTSCSSTASTSTIENARVYRNFDALVVNDTHDEQYVDLTNSSSACDKIVSESESHAAAPFQPHALLKKIEVYEKYAAATAEIQHVYDLVEQNIVGLACLGHVQIDWHVEAFTKQCLICNARLPHAHSAAYGNRDCPRLSKLFLMPERPTYNMDMERNDKIVSQFDAWHEQQQHACAEPKQNIMTCDNCCIVCNNLAVCIVCLAQRDFLRQFVRAFERMYNADVESFRSLETSNTVAQVAAEVGFDFFT